MESVNFLSVLIAVASLVILGVPAFVLVKLKALPKSAAEVLSTIALYVCSPAQILMSFQKTSFNPAIGKNILIVFGLSFVAFTLMIILVNLFLRGKSQELKRRVCRFAVVFPNCGYMGIPFLQMLFSNPAIQGEAILYTAITISIFHVYSWTYGVYSISKDKRNISIKNIILNPCIISVVLGFILFIGFKKPIVELAEVGTTAHTILSSLVKSINFMGDMVTPVAMFVIGIKLANVNLKQLFLDKWAYIATALRLIIMPMIIIFLVVFLPVPQIVKFCMFFLFAMPSATNTAMFAIKYGGDGDFASIEVLLSTVLSIITIPIMFLFFQLFI